MHGSSDDLSNFEAKDAVKTEEMGLYSGAPDVKRAIWRGKILKINIEKNF
jgi:hypothetical protein